MRITSETHKKHRNGLPWIYLLFKDWKLFVCWWELLIWFFSPASGKEDQDGKEYQDGRRPRSRQVHYRSGYTSVVGVVRHEKCSMPVAGTPATPPGWTSLQLPTANSKSSYCSTFTALGHSKPKWWCRISKVFRLRDVYRPSKYFYRSHKNIQNGFGGMYM